jgi:peptide/nickel transport system ATP-binding protein
MPDVDSDLTAEPIGGYPPSMSALPAGCSFHPRCPVAEDRCRAAAPPELLSLRGRRVACPPTVEGIAVPGGVA